MVPHQYEGAYHWEVGGGGGHWLPADSWVCKASTCASAGWDQPHTIEGWWEDPGQRLTEDEQDPEEGHTRESALWSSKRRLPSNSPSAGPQQPWGLTKQAGL